MRINISKEEKIEGKKEGDKKEIYDEGGMSE